jgi:assimilatory nitrate reductase catalytic subunit
VGSQREAFLGGDRLDRVLFTTTSGALPPRDWLAELFAAEVLTTADRAALLIGRAPGRPADTSPLVCACRNVRAAAIGRAIAAGAEDVDTVSDATGAGSACGSCRPEIARLLAAAATPEIADAA